MRLTSTHFTFLRSLISLVALGLLSVLPGVGYAATAAATTTPAPTAAAPASAACPALLDYKFKSLQGQPQNLCQYAGRVVVVVNTASYCGFTEQYKGLQAIYDKYKDIAFVGNIPVSLDFKFT